MTNEVAELPAWFGKLPGMGDFAYRRVTDSFRSTWDRWLQVGLMQLRERHADWTERYLEGPLWFFVLAEDVMGAEGWTGVLMPSVDSVGRYFPFTVLTGFESEANARRWWAVAAQAALEGLHADLDATRFETVLQRLFAPGAAPSSISGTTGLPLPAAGESLWLTHPDGDEGWRMTVPGLPVQSQFDALFGFEAEGAAQRVGAP